MIGSVITTDDASVEYYTYKSNKRQCLPNTKNRVLEKAMIYHYTVAYEGTNQYRSYSPTYARY